MHKNELPLQTGNSGIGLASKPSQLGGLHSWLIGLSTSMHTKSPTNSNTYRRIKIMTRILFIAVCLAVLLSFTRSPATADQELKIGSPAPALDIEHWLQDGNGFFKPVEKFEKDKVYVVEFWATWCGPCIQSMPHLAELQNKYRGRGVQIISITDESLDAIGNLMDKQHPQAGVPFSEVTAAYCLTTDPDRSTHKSYMEASGQRGIPTSFIVGKSGQIEWIGHPMDMDGPLELIVTDGWDRNVFSRQFEAKADYELAMQKLSMLAGAGKFDEAIKLVDEKLASAKENELPEMVIQWTDIRFGMNITTGNVDDETVAYYRKHIAELKDDPIALGRFGYSLHDAFQQGGNLGSLPGYVVEAIEAKMDAAPADAVPFLYNTIAQLHAADKKYAKAVEAQQKSIDTATGRQKGRLQPFLDELKEKAGMTKTEQEAEQETELEK